MTVSYIKRAAQVTNRKNSDFSLTRFDRTSLIKGMDSSEVFLFPALSRSGGGTKIFK